LGKLSRPSRGWLRKNCPFHESKSGLSFWINLASGGFFCHGCEAKGGDVIAFVMLRDKLTFKESCALLGAWDDFSPLSVAQFEAMRQARERKLAELEQQKANDRSQRIVACDWLHCVKRIHRDAGERLDVLEAGALQKIPHESEVQWEILALSFSAIRDAEEVYCRLAGITLSE
jgi:CHC2 zinc finger